MNYEESYDSISKNLPARVNVIDGDTITVGGVTLKIDQSSIVPDQGCYSAEAVAVFGDDKIVARVLFDFVSYWETLSEEEQEALCDQGEACNWDVARIVSIY